MLIKHKQCTNIETLSIGLRSVRGKYQAGPGAGQQRSARAHHDPHLRVAHLPISREVRPAHKVRLVSCNRFY